MRIYLSGPITGHENYMEEFELAEKAVKDLFNDTVEIINPAKVNASLPASTTWNEYMSVCYELLDMADAVYMMPDWKTSTGACIEYGWALRGDMIIIDNNDRRKDK